MEVERKDVTVGEPFLQENHSDSKNDNDTIADIPLAELRIDTVQLACPDFSVKEQVVEEVLEGLLESKKEVEDEDDLIDIDGQDGPEPTIKAADELKAAIGQGQGDIDILGNDPEPSGLGPDTMHGTDHSIGLDLKAGYSLPPQEEEEEEDIDIVEVDEEEEAKVKQAMGVGEGMPVVNEEFVSAAYEAAQRDAGVEGDSGLDRVLAEAEEAAGVAADMADAAHASVLDVSMKGKRGLRSKRKMGNVHLGEEDTTEVDFPGTLDPEDSRRTRQRTNRPGTRKLQPTEGETEDDNEEEELEDDEGIDVDYASQGITRPRSGSSLHGRASKASHKRIDEPLVKFAIKSFTVPELVVALPESSTVGQLKKAVMDSAMKILGGGLRVRALLQGKRLQDEAQSLSQAGINGESPVSGKPSDALSFMLEPTSLYSLDPEDTDPVLVLSQTAGSASHRPMYGVPAAPQQLFGASTSAAGRVKLRSKSKSDDDEEEEDDEEYEVNEELYLEPRGRSRTGRGSQGDVPSPHTTRVAAAQALAAIRAQAEANTRGVKVEAEGGMGLEEGGLEGEAGALVLHPSVTGDQRHGMVGGHSMALVQHKPRASSMALVGLEGRRRIRRPFTVSEVVALVEAVEKLGTGRWREVKLRAFAHAKHRTYVDLKDKWKTLVHTAQIAPHQRRGEPVPPELLERVTKAHAYWTAQLRAQQEERDR